MRREGKQIGVSRIVEWGCPEMCHRNARKRKKGWCLERGWGWLRKNEGYCFNTKLPVWIGTGPNRYCPVIHSRDAEMKDSGLSMLSSYQASDGWKKIMMGSICHNLICQRQRSGRRLKEKVRVFAGQIPNQQDKSSELFTVNLIFCWKKKKKGKKCENAVYQTFFFFKWKKKHELFRTNTEHFHKVNHQRTLLSFASSWNVQSLSSKVVQEKLYVTV